MRRGYLSEIFVGVMAKRLKAVEVDKKISNQHEFNGVAKMKELLGLNRIQNKPALFFWFNDDEELITEYSQVTWYNAREDQSKRSAEYRLYFRANEVMRKAREGDLLIVARKQGSTEKSEEDKIGELIVIVAGNGSSAERQLGWLFGISMLDLSDRASVHSIEDRSDREIEFISRQILEELGITAQEKDSEMLDAFLDLKLDELIKPFKNGFPSTAKFSHFARTTLPHIDARENPDKALLSWIDREEKLFRRLERRLISDRLREGFNQGENVDVDEFIAFSLSVQNRRKSRAGYAVENHLHRIFTRYRLKFDHNAKTENRSKPDFLFPGSKEYHNSSFPAAHLDMLGVKSSCKERWRQVLAEADRIEQKHLLTLQSGISENQTNQMVHNDLRLIVPAPLHQTFSEAQQDWLMSLRDFVEYIQDRQKISRSA